MCEICGSKATWPFSQGAAHALAAALLAIVAGGVKAVPAEALRLAPGERTCRTLAPEASLGIAIDASARGPLRLAVEQRGIDVEIRVSPTAEAPGRTIDSPQDRQGEESLWLASPGEIPSIEIKARERGAPGGEICLRVETPAPDSVPAWGALDRAGVLYARGDRSSWRESLAAYQETLAAFRVAADRSGEARALFSLAVVSRLVDEPKAALSQGAEALPLLLDLGQGKLAAALANEIGLDHLLLGDNAAARASFAQAEKLAEENGDPFNQAVAQSNLCRMQQVAGDLVAARACYGAARQALAAAQAPALEAAAWISAGRIEDVLGEPEAALAAYRSALALQERVGDELGRARTLNNLGLLEQELGRFDQGIAAYAAALAKFTALADRRWQARVKNNLGLAYGQVGQKEAAEAQWQAALPLWRAAEDAAGEASTSLNLALAALDGGRADDALARIDGVLALYRAAGDRRGEGMALSAKARGQAARGEPEAARATFSQALERLVAVGDLAHQADAENGLGELELAANNAAARPPFERSLALARALGQRRREARALAGLGRLARVEGNLESALGYFDDALAALETERIHLPGAEAQTSFSALATGVSEEGIETALALDRAHPGMGWSARALARVERSRGRALVELLAQAGVDLEAAVDPARAAHRAELSRRMAAKAERAAGNPKEAIRAQLAREAAEISTQLDLLDAQTRAQAPAVESLLDPPALDPEAFAGALDAETLVLVFHLGGERSTLWSLVRGRIESFDLPPRRELEGAALDLFRSLRRFDPAEREAEEKALGALGSRLLGPVASGLGRRRVVIVTDGALAYLPWAALGMPGTGRPLVAEHEISFIPSLSALAAVRGRAAGRPPARGLIAAFADPVFAAGDPRLAVGGRQAASAQGPSHSLGTAEKRGAEPASTTDRQDPADRGEPFERLPGSAAEVGRIEALAKKAAAGDPRRVLAGFAAARSALDEGGLAGFRVLHFATHGVIDAESPALSGLALSRFTPAGEEIGGFLHLRDIYRLKLGADLVVLSGCETALGREVRGEGLVGLARGFLYAGASRVVASLWPVDDRAAVAFMENFYRALWLDRLGPAAALGKAQREVAAERRTRDPAFWAGWVLLGDGG